MIVDDLDIEGVTVTPDETEPPLPVDADAVLSRTIATQGLQTIPWRAAKKVECRRRMQLGKLALGDRLESTERPRRLAGKELGGGLATKRFDHRGKVLRL